MFVCVFFLPFLGLFIFFLCAYNSFNIIIISTVVVNYQLAVCGICTTHTHTILINGKCLFSSTHTHTETHKYSKFLHSLFNIKCRGTSHTSHISLIVAVHTCMFFCIKSVSFFHSVILFRIWYMITLKKRTHKEL